MKTMSFIIRTSLNSLMICVRHFQFLFGGNFHRKASQFPSLQYRFTLAYTSVVWIIKLARFLLKNYQTSSANEIFPNVFTPIPKENTSSVSFFREIAFIKFRVRIWSDWLPRYNLKYSSSNKRETRVKKKK